MEYENHVTELSFEELERLWSNSVPSSSSELLGPQLQEAVGAQLARDAAEDEALEGSAADELELAIDVSSLLRQLGVRPTRADLRALCAAVHAADVPALAVRLFQDLSEEMQSTYADPAIEAADAEEGSRLGPAAQGLAGAMELGGWDRSSTEAFLLGRRPLPARAGGEGLGGLLTRYLDPLFGAGGNDTVARAALLESLQTAWMPGSKARAEGGAGGEGKAETAGAETNEVCEVRGEGGASAWGDIDVTVWTDADQVTPVKITAQHVVRKLLECPVEAESCLIHGRGQLDSPTGIRNKLKALGLPVPCIDNEVKQLYVFAKDVWSAVAAKRVALAEALAVESMRAVP
mmetsp:Transcript_130109/g.362503  ORF Transcript_130109/g.362503 Transcript_130109/m.362503 type:complete len:348 (+) Transcript_130109:3-1046(+)